MLVQAMMTYSRISTDVQLCCVCVKKVFALMLTQECDGYEDDLCPLVIDTAAISPAEKKKYELPNSMDHSEVHEQLPDLDINEQNSYSPGCLTTEPNSQSNTLVSSMGTSSKPDVSLSWDGATICPSSIPKNKNGGRLISPSKTRRKSDKVGIVL